MRFFLSKHAQERLAERSTLTESQLLELLQNGKYRRIHTSRRTPDISQKKIDYYIEKYGFTFNEMKRYGMVQLQTQFKHLMVWSCPDAKPLTLVVSHDNGTIVTVLNSDDFSENDWSDKVTDESVLDARRKAEGSHFQSIKRYEMYAHWIGEDGLQKRKNFKEPEIVSIAPLTPQLEELEQIVRSHVVTGSDIHLIIRNRKNISEIVLEKFLGSTYSCV